MHTVNYNTVAAAFNSNVLEICTVMQAAKALLLKSNDAEYCTDTVAALHKALKDNEVEDRRFYVRVSERKALRIMQHNKLKKAIEQYCDERYDQASNTLIHAMLKRADTLNYACL